MKSTVTGTLGVTSTLLALSASSICASAATDFDANREFSTGANPGGVWSYGWKGTATGGFSLVTQPTTGSANNGTQIRGWILPVQTEPAVYWNGTSNSALFGGGTAVVPPGGIWIHPGLNGRPENLGALRFTAPSNGNYQITATVAPLYSPSGPAGDTDFHVVAGVTEIFGAFLSRTSATNFSGMVSLVAGDTVDFAVGRGADANEYGSALKLTAVVTPTNAPVTAPKVVSLTPGVAVHAGALAVLQVVADGTAPFRYQWLFNGEVIDGANSSVFTIPSVQLSSAGSYSVVITNVAGAVTSSVVTVSLVPVTDFDASREFSVGANPGGVWSYGWKPTPVGAFNLLAQPWTMSAENGTSLRGWNLPVQTEPAVYWNGTTNSASFGGGTAVVPPGGIWIHPGFNGRPENFGALRFTAPSNGNYNITAAVSPLYSPSGPAGDTDFHVSVGAAEVFSAFLSRESGTNFLRIFAMNSGQSVDFSVGRGADGNEYGSALKLSVLVTPTTNEPPPAVPPSILSLSPSQSAIVGSPVNLMVSASGTEPLVFQWLLDGAPVNGASGSSLSIGTVQMTNAGNYSVVITNIAGAITSAVVTLTVVPTTDFDANRDFSAGSNPGGVWSYGWKGAVAGPFNLVAESRSFPADNGTQVSGWMLPVTTEPAVYWNAGAAPAVFGGGTAVVPPRGIWIHPGFNGRPENLGALRFCAPSNGNYHIAVAVEPLYSPAGPAGDTDFHVVVQGNEVFGANLSRASATNYSGVTSLLAGQAIEFAVGRGADGNEYGSALKLAAVITPTTNNATVVTNQPPEVVVYSDFDVGRDFGMTANPGGVWSYGWKETPIGTFGLLDWLTTAACDNGVPVTGWLLRTTGQPAVYANTSGSVGITGGGQAVLPPRTVWAHPGVNGRPESFSVIRFTAPSNGNYEISAGVAPVYSGSLAGDSDFHLVSKGVELLARFLAPHESLSFTNILSLNTGDSLDFAVGRGSDGNEYGSGRRIAAVITPTTNAPTTISNAPPEPPVVHADFDVARDFGAATNPSGVWSYGWKETLGGACTLLNWRITPRCDNGILLAGWVLSSYGQPAVYCNTSDANGIIGGGQGVLPPRTLLAHAGVNGRPENFSVVRFTAPSNGNYQINSTLAPVYSGGLAGDTDFHLLKNGGELLGRFLGAHETMSFAEVVPLSSGDTLDFAFGRGADGNEYGSGRRLAAVIAFTTNEATLVTNLPPASTNQPSVGPVIVSQPAPYQSAYVADTVTFTLNVSGAPPLDFQWLFNGTPLSGARSPSLVISNVKLAQAGTYRVVVGNAAGSVTSDGSTLNVLPVTSGGTINFANSSSNRVLDVGGASFVPAGGSLVIGLFGGPSADALQQIGGTAAFILPGRFTGGTRTVPNVQPGQTAFLQVKVWDSVFGQTYDAAVAAGSRHGSSPLFQAPLGGGLMPPPLLTAMPAFTLLAPSVVPPQIVLQPAGGSVLLSQDTSLSVSAIGGGLSYQWFHNGAPKSGATLSSLSLPAAQKSFAGEYFVVVQNSAGSVTSQVATLNVNVLRTLAVTSPPDTQEGALVSVPIILESDGSVASMSFVLHYNGDLLALPELIWDPAVTNGAQTVLSPDPSDLLGWFSLSNAVVPAGTQTVATIQFRARTVASNSTTELLLDLGEFFGPQNAPLLHGNDVRHGSATVVPGVPLVGDNNGNGVLDAGDASLAMRLVAELDSKRDWDAARNDVDQNAAVDAGDVMAILEAAAQLPESPSLVSPKSGGGPAQIYGQGLVSPAVLRASNGLVRVQVRLNSLRIPVSGAAFTLSYPATAIRLAGPESLTAGSLVPYGSPSVWNVAPTNDYGHQVGRVRFVTSSASAWPTNNGVLAELVFAVQPAATNQFAWPIALESTEISSVGYNYPLAPGRSIFVTRNPHLGQLSGPVRFTNGPCRFQIIGDAEATYVVEASTNLSHWVVLTNVLNTSGKITFDDPAASGLPHRFYRTRPVQP